MLYRTANWETVHKNALSDGASGAAKYNIELSLHECACCIINMHINANIVVTFISAPRDHRPIATFYAELPHSPFDRAFLCAKDGVRRRFWLRQPDIGCRRPALTPAFGEERAPLAQALGVLRAELAADVVLLKAHAKALADVVDGGLQRDVRVALAAARPAYA